MMGIDTKAQERSELALRMTEECVNVAAARAFGVADVTRLFDGILAALNAQEPKPELDSGDVVERGVEVRNHLLYGSERSFMPRVVDALDALIIEVEKLRAQSRELNVPKELIDERDTLFLANRRLTGYVDELKIEVEKLRADLKESQQSATGRKIRLDVVTGDLRTALDENDCLKRDSLRTENARLKREHERLRGECYSANTRADEVESENACLKRDLGRYKEFRRCWALWIKSSAGIRETDDWRKMIDTNYACHSQAESASCKDGKQCGGGGADD